MTRLHEVVEAASDSDWDRMVRTARFATFYHTSTWAKICEQAFPKCRATARLYQFDDGTEVLLPGAVETAARGAVTAFKSVYPSDFGGLVAPTPLTAEQVDAVSDDLRHSGFSSVHVYENPFDVQPPLRGFSASPDFTQTVVIDDGIDGVLRHMKYQERQSLRRSERCGVVVERRFGEEAVEEFYRLYLLSAARWGEQTTWLRPIELLRAAVQLGGDSVRVRLAMLDGEAIGGQVDYLHDSVGIVAWRAFDYEHRSSYPNVAMQVASVADAVRDGIRYFDLGPSSGLAGPETLKERYGAVRLGFRVWHWEHPTHKAYTLGRKGFDRAQAAVHSLTHH